MPLFHLGNECWLSGTSSWAINIAGGKDVVIDRITGAVTATPQYGASTWSSSKLRNSLVTLHYEPISTPIAPSMAPLIAGRPEQHNGSVNADILVAANPKLVGMSNMCVPIIELFDPGILVPTGTLMLRVINGSPGPLREDKDVTVTETHLNIQWRYAGAQ